MIGERALRVGELARRTGLSVRMLHYYDEIGLLHPSQRSPAGYRLYSAADIGRLQQISSLRQLGFGLAEVGHCLAQPRFSPQHIIHLHLERLQEQIGKQQQLVQRLETLATHLRTEEVTVAEFILTIEEIKKMEAQFTPEQMEAIRQRGEELGTEHLRAVEAEWPQLMERVGAAMDAGVDPADPDVQAMARRWMELVRQFTGGDPGIERVLRTRYEADPTGGHPQGNPRTNEYMAYVQKALAVGQAQG